MSQPASHPTASVAVIGGGLSGAAIASRILSLPDTSIHIIDDRAELAVGLTYGDVEDCHILNVPAGNMSLWQERPNDFLDWSRTHGARVGFDSAADAQPDSYLPRRLFGHYARHVLDTAIAHAADGSRLVHHRTRATALVRDGGGFVVTLADGQTVKADAVVYVPGNNPPKDLWPVSGSGTAYQANPWHPDVLADLDADGPVLIIGTGLSMVDMIYSLDRRGHRGPILAVSRHGLLPGARGRVTPAPAAVQPADAAHGCRWLLRRVREAIAARGDDWRAVIDGLRPVTEGVWANLSVAEKRRFLRHVRPYWEVARHRMPAESELLLRSLRARDILTVQAARIGQVIVTGASAEATIVPRHGAAQRRTFARVINCTPGACDYAQAADPLVRDMVEGGLLRPDPLHLGIDTRADGTLIGRDDTAIEGLFTMGPPLRGGRFEVTAVPDIRVQTDALHATIAGFLGRTGAKRAIPKAG